MVCDHWWAMSLARRLLVGAAAFAAVPLLAALPIGPAEASPTSLVVTITASAFSPGSATIEQGSTVQYLNKSGGTVIISYSSNWPGSPPPETIGNGSRTAARKLTTIATYTATGIFGTVGQNSVKVVKATTPKPSPSKTTTPPKPSPSKTTAAPKPSPTRTSASPIPSSGAVSGPPILPGVSIPPSPTSAGAGNPDPSIAPTEDPVAADGSKESLVQGNPARRLGLPGAIAAVLVLGLLFGIARVLLAFAPARPPTERHAD
jgi:plastocyanin